MSTLLEKANEIKNEKDSKILPENIKKNVQIFDVVGTFEGGSSAEGVKLFATTAEMQADPDKHEGDKAVVYSSVTTPVAEDTEFISCDFPDTVVLDEPFTGDIFCDFIYADGTSGIDLTAYLTSDSFRVSGWDEKGQMYNIEYVSSDGITYTNEYWAETLEFDKPLKCSLGMFGEFDPAIGKFMQINVSIFGGIFNCTNGQYSTARNQLKLCSASQLLPGATVYGKNGLVTSNGYIVIPDNSFSDTPGYLYGSIQKAYDAMEPMVLTEDDKWIYEGIYVVPAKTDGTPLLDVSTITDMEALFQSCASLVSVAQLDTSNATNMTYMFHGCRRLVSIPPLNTSNVTDMTRMFEGCSSLVSVPLLDTSNVTSMYNMFENCSSLSDASLNTILQMCTNAVKIENRFKTLKHLNLSKVQATKCTTLSNWSACQAAGWTTGY